MEKIIQSKKFKIAAVIVGVILGALIIFAAGISVGIHKGKFSCNFGRNYEKNFMGKFGGRDDERGFMSGRGMIDGFGGGGFRNAHGIAGQIISINDNKIVVKNRDNQENAIAVTDKTLIKSGQSDLKITDLKSGDQIVVMGRPDASGVVNADLIRIFAANPNDNSGNSAPVDESFPQAPNPANNSTN